MLFATPVGALSYETVSVSAVQRLVGVLFIYLCNCRRDAFITATTMYSIRYCHGKHVKFKRSITKVNCRSVCVSQSNKSLRVVSNATAITVRLMARNEWILWNNSQLCWADKLCVASIGRGNLVLFGAFPPFWGVRHRCLCTRFS